MNFIKMFLIGLICSSLGSIAVAAESYKEGPVMNISYIKIKPGMSDAYMKYLQTDYKRLMESQKKAGLIVDYAVFSTSARNPQEADLILTTTYANMASLDRVDEAEALAAKVFGDRPTMSKATQDRGAMREILGNQLIRQLILK
jgi:hypothetical protein